MRVKLTQPLRPDGRDERSCLREDREYSVLAIECDSYRLLNEFAEPTLHDHHAFEIVDDTEPDFWVTEIIDGCLYSGPVEWRRVGFFEDWHDGSEEAIATFRQTVLTRYPDAAARL